MKMVGDKSFFEREYMFLIAAGIGLSAALVVYFVLHSLLAAAVLGACASICMLIWWSVKYFGPWMESIVDPDQKPGSDA
jgi:hypothetical protein